MPVSYTLIDDLVFMSAEGSLTPEDMRAALEAVISDPGFRKGSRILLHDIGSDYSLTQDETKDAAAHLDSLREHLGARIDVVVRKDAHYGIGKMIQVFCEREGIAFNVHREWAEPR